MTRHRRAVLGSNSGFTLIELLVGLSLLSLVSLLLFGGLRVGLRVWEVGTVRIAAANEIEQAQHLLRRQFSEAQPILVGSELESAPTLFRGDATTLLFVAPLPVHSAAGGPYIFFLAADDVTGDQLLLRWRRYRAETALAPDFDPNDESALVRGIESIAFEYFGRPVAGAPPRWLGRWDGSFGLPLLVRLRVAFPRGDGRHWPDFVVNPRMWTAQS